MPVAVVVEAAGVLEDAGELHAAGTHVLDVGLRGGVVVFEGSLFLGFAPEDFVVAVGVERRIDVDQINAGIGQLGELFEIVAAIDDAGVEQGGWTASGGGWFDARAAGGRLPDHGLKVTEQERCGNSIPTTVARRPFHPRYSRSMIRTPSTGEESEYERSETQH